MKRMQKTMTMLVAALMSSYMIGAPLATPAALAHEACHEETTSELPKGLPEELIKDLSKEPAANYSEEAVQAYAEKTFGVQSKDLSKTQVVTFSKDETLIYRYEVNGDVVMNVENGAVVNFTSGIHVNGQSSLTITGNGTIKAYLPSIETDKAGIGGNRKTSGGNVTIDGENIRVEAQGAYGAAGIGAGNGGEYNATFRLIKGTVIATSGVAAAAIGGGRDASNCSGTVEVYGGHLEAQAVNQGADCGGSGIGSGIGNPSSCSTTVNIYGGEVHASGCEEGSGIGAGAYCNATDCHVNIYGGQVTASAKGLAAAIGAGGGTNSQRSDTGDGAHVKIAGGTVICQSEHTAIGHGRNSDDMGTLEISGDYEVFAGNGAGNFYERGDKPFSAAERVPACQYRNNAISTKCDHSYRDDHDHTRCLGCGHYFPGGYETCAIGDRAFNSLTAAFQAAQNGETIRLLKDTNEMVYINNGSELTLDLNGHTLTNIANWENALYIYGGTTLTISDSSPEKTGKITQSFEGTTREIFKPSAVFVSDGSAKVIVDGATISSDTSDAIYNKGTLVINDATVSSDTEAAIHNEGTTTINGGSFKGADGKSVLNSQEDPNTFIIYAGKFSDDAGNGSAYLRPDRRKLVFDGEWYVVRTYEEMEAYNINTDELFYTLEEAIDNAKGTIDPKIKLLKDVSTQVNIPEGQHITIDLGGKTLTGVKADNELPETAIVSAGTLKIEDSVGRGTIKSKGYGIYQDGGVLSVKAGHIYADVSAVFINTERERAMTDFDSLSEISSDSRTVQIVGDNQAYILFNGNKASLVADLGDEWYEGVVYSEDTPVYLDIYGGATIRAMDYPGEVINLGKGYLHVYDGNFLYKHASVRDALKTPETVIKRGYFSTNVSSDFLAPGSVCQRINNSPYVEAPYQVVAAEE